MNAVMSKEGACTACKGCRTFTGVGPVGGVRVFFGIKFFPPVGDACPDQNVVLTKPKTAKTSLVGAGSVGYLEKDIRYVLLVGRFLHITKLRRVNC